MGLLVAMCRVLSFCLSSGIGGFMFVSGARGFAWSSWVWLGRACSPLGWLVVAGRAWGGWWLLVALGGVSGCSSRLGWLFGA